MILLLLFIINESFGLNSTCAKAYIVSHRRSGTHALSNFIHQNYDIPVYKVNHPDPRFLSCKCFCWLKQTGCLFKTFRDPRDVAISTYYYRRAFDSEAKHSSLQKYLQRHGAEIVNEYMAQHAAWDAEHVDWLSLVIYRDIVHNEEKILRILDEKLYNRRRKTKISSLPFPPVMAFKGKGVNGWNTAPIDVKKLLNETYNRWVDFEGKELSIGQRCNCLQEIKTCSEWSCCSKACPSATKSHTQLCSGKHS